MTHWIELGTALFAYVIVLIVPGPNMVIVYNYSVQKNATASILSGLGYGITTAVLAILSYIGISALQDKIPHLEEIMFIVSGLLLIWFGCKIKIVTDLQKTDHKKPAKGISYLFSAFMLNIANPKTLGLLISIYGGILATILRYEAVVFILFCFLMEVSWYYILWRIFSSDFIVGISSKFIYKITYISKTLLIVMGGYFLIHSMVALINL
ncbi:MAG: LysE family translocator [Candidatus Halichondribacter symbioticus]